MKHTQIISTLALFALPIVASAQPDPNNAPKGDNPANRAVGGGRNRIQIQNMTPEQRETQMRTTLKRQLTRANVTSVAQQNAIADYVLNEAEARQKLEEATRALQTGLRNTTLTDAQIAGLLNDYNATVTDDKARHQKGLDTLKAAIDVTQFPRLEALLTLAGIYGENTVSAGNLTTLLGPGARLPRIRQNAAVAAVNGGGATPAQLNGNLGGARGNMLGRMNRRNNPAPF